MDVERRPRKARKQGARDDDDGGATRKKAKINGVVERAIENDDKSMDSVVENTVENTADSTRNQDEFDGKYLRTLLSTSDGLHALRKFVTICRENKDRDLATEYLLAGGGVLEILRLLDSDRKNAGDAVIVFSAISILLMKILAMYPQYQNSAVEACRHLLNSHMSVVYSMFSSQSDAKQRKVILRLLAAIVSLDGNLSRELLAHLSLQQQVLDGLVRHSKHADSHSVRTCFVHFVLAFLVERNTSVIRMLLDKRSLLSSIFPGLMYDSKDIVSLVLTTVRTYVLENVDISKTTKLHVFSTPVVLNLVSLYNWKGPSNLPRNKKRGSDECEEFLAGKEIVNDVVHEFLTTLLTSHRYGIIFHDRTLGSSRNKHNQLVHTVLQSLEKPWKHEKPSDLVIKIMKACPDLIRSQYSSVEPFIEPRVSHKWICLLRFVKKIVESVDPTVCLKICSLELTTNNLINTLLSLIIPNMIVKSVILPGLDHDSLLVRHEVLTLLLAILHQLKAISLTMKEFYKTLAVQSQITDFILRTVPNLQAVLRVCNRTFEDKMTVLEDAENIQNPELVDHLDVVLSVLHSYKDVCPELLDGSISLQPNVLLSSLNNVQVDDDEVDGRTKIAKMNHVKVKVIQFLLALDSSIFAPQEKVFKEVLLFLIPLVCQKTLPESYDATKTLLNGIGLFEACDEQLDIWIDGFSVATNPEETKELTQWFVSVLKSAIKHTDRYINKLMQAEETINGKMANFDVKRAEDIINELFNKVNKTSSLFDKGFLTAETFSINGRFSSYAKTNNMANDIDKILNEENVEKRTIKRTDEYITQTSKQMSNSNMKKVEDTNDVLPEKTEHNNFLLNINDHIHNKDSSMLMSFLINKQLIDFNLGNTDDAINESFDKFHEGESSLHRMQPCTSVSPLLCCALQRIAEKDCSTVVLAYLSHVIVHTLHHQVIPELLVHLVADLNSLPVRKYLRSWSSGKKPISLKSKLPSLRLLQKMSNMLLRDTKVDATEFAELFGDGHSVCRFKYREEEFTIKHSLALHDIKALLKMTVFYLAQLVKQGILQQAQNENCKIALVSLFNIAQSVDQENTIIPGTIARCFFTHPILLHYFSPFCEEVSKDSMENMITQTILEICEVVELQKKNGNANTYDVFSVFRDKLLVQFGNIIENNPLKYCSNNYNIAVALLEVLSLKVQDVVKLLLALVKLEKVVFISCDKQNLSVFGHIVPVLLDISCSKESRLRRDRCSLLNDQFVAKLSLHLIYLKSNKINYASRWEEALTKYLIVFPHNIVGISVDTFASLLMKGIATSTIRLIAILINRNTKLIPSLMKHFLKAENTKQGDIVFPILGSNLSYKWNDRLLRSLYECHGDDIATYLTEPQNTVSWIEENTATIVYLIENTFQLDLCEKTCDTISQSGDKLDMVSIHFIQLLESLYKRYESLITVKEKALMDLIKVLLHVMTLTLKKELKNVEKIRLLCAKLDDAVNCLKKYKRDFIFSSLSKSHSWPQFTRFSLKLGLKNIKDDEAQSSILKTLSNLCDIAYEDNVNDEYVKTLFEMTTFHSEFVNIMLGSSSGKGDLVELLRILTRKNHAVMAVSHVPLYLAAYKATLSHIDQRILQILQHYEAHNIKIQQYWPYLWGNAAAIRYSVKGETDTALWRQPSTSEIFNLFDKDIVSDTVTNYPVRRALKNDELYEGSNVYDPAFYLPLLCTLLAENNIVACHKISQSGALALVLAACCSDSIDVRMAAYTIISRYYFHLEGSRTKEKLLWMRLIDVLRNGVVSLKRPLKDVRLSCLVAIFLARASLVASQPLHPLYLPLHNFFMAKPALDLNTIPELLQLLHSSHVEHKTHRHWILENIRDGIKEEGDVSVALKCVLFKMLLDFYTCILSDTKTKKLILEVIASTTRIPKASLLLVRGYGMLPWLHETVNRLGVRVKTEIHTIDTIVTIIENLLNSFNSLTEDTSHYRFLLFSILSQLKAHFPRDATDDILARYMNILKRLIAKSGSRKITRVKASERLRISSEGKNECCC